MRMRQNELEFSNDAEVDELETQPALPVCSGKPDEIKGVDCLVGKLLPICARNVLPDLLPGEEIDCRVQPFCKDHPGLAINDECYQE